MAISCYICLQRPPKTTARPGIPGGPGAAGGVGAMVVAATRGRSAQRGGVHNGGRAGESAPRRGCPGPPRATRPGGGARRRVRPWTGSGRRVAGANPSLIPLHPQCQTRSGRRRPNRAGGSESARAPPALASGAHSLSLSLSTSVRPVPHWRSAWRPGTFNCASSPRCGRPAPAGPRNARAAWPSRYPGRELPACSSPPR